MIKKKDSLVIMIVLITVVLIGVVIVFFDHRIKTMDNQVPVIPVETGNK